MAVSPKLGSPIELPVRGVPRHMTLPQTLDVQSDFVKSGSPYDQLNRFFVGLSPTWGPVSAIEFFEGSHLAYAEDFKEISYLNLVNLKEIFIAKQNENQQLLSKFCLGEVQFTTISKGILQALKYVHEVLGICHGNVTLSTVLINQDGVVKLDLQAVCLIACLLLRLDETSVIYGTMGLLTEDFTGCFWRVTAADLLKVGRSSNISLAANLSRLASFPTY
ncbi:kinase-like protein [Aspergillus alliaceus]|uniref:kinase-like protein n=1 Tax=Petromyces alliaceus TaxID=209559 RepID=UPI0012A7095D|nr:kinase-like protein [Aspergillus alliaceus]KAB8239020.1 kinase-like protein [Aspergillus alliaceus]